jgi:hypothetical protein
MFRRWQQTFIGGNSLQKGNGIVCGLRALFLVLGVGLYGENLIPSGSAFCLFAAFFEDFALAAQSWVLGDFYDSYQKMIAIINLRKEWRDQNMIKEPGF